MRGSVQFVQALRGIAALSVVLWHASRYLGPYGTGIGGRLFAPSAAMGVDLFFLISGFIMFHTTRSSTGSLADVESFAIKRATRIWPLWLIVLGIQVVYLGDSTFLSDPYKRAWLVNSALFVPTAGAGSDGAPVYGVPVVGVGWTLNYEMYFYAFFGLTMLFGRLRWIAFSAWVAVTLLLIPLLRNGIAAPVDILMLFSPSNESHLGIRYFDMMTNPLIWMFIIGVALGALYHSRLRLLDRHIAIGLVFAAAAGVGCQYAIHYRTYHGVLNWGLTLIPFFLALSLLDKQRALRPPRALTYLGDISFSLYLLHPFVQGAFDSVARTVRPDALPKGFAPIVATTILSIATASLSYRYLERGLCERLRKRLERQRTVAQPVVGS